MIQQDAFEFLLHLLKLVTRSQHPTLLQDPVKSFRFVMEQRLQCMSCKKVRYRTDEQDNISVPVSVRRTPKGAEDSADKKDEFEPVTFKECLDIFTSSEIVELTCPSCSSKGGFTKRSLFKTFPQTLAVNARRFELVNWVPTKLDVPVVVGDEAFKLDAYASNGLQETEELLPEDVDSPQVSTNSFTPNEATLAQLEAMGFPRSRCEKALHATGNNDSEAAMNWLFAHMEDPDIDEPLVLEIPCAGGGIEMLGAMGISPPQARKALKETGGDVNRALDWVFSHPDDQGDFGDEDVATPATKPAGTMAEMAGTSELSTTFRLSSIVCHKGGSIHAG